MNFKYTTILINFFLLVFSFKVMSDNEGTKKIGNFEKWSVYAKSKSLCYMIAQPEKSEGEYKVRGRVRIVVYRNNLENKNKNAVGIDFGYSFTENSKAFIEIDNKNKLLNAFKTLLNDSTLSDDIAKAAYKVVENNTGATKEQYRDILNLI